MQKKNYRISNGKARIVFTLPVGTQRLTIQSSSLNKLDSQLRRLCPDGLMAEALSNTV
ncbi:hypothetical protein [Oleidesulfovibrio sp.]|uniref:hypothetical protein n=1 Tax=Oleidesulfovibrio sp. TaxID=2909707 RepID=UPI003A8BBE35